MRRRSKPCALLLLLLCCFALSCGTRGRNTGSLNASGGNPKLSQVAEKYRPLYSQKREQLRAIAQKLPPLGSPLTSKTRHPLDPKPIYDNVREGEKGLDPSNPKMEFSNNTFIAAAEELLNPDDKAYTEFASNAWNEKFHLVSTRGSLAMCKRFTEKDPTSFRDWETTETWEQVCEDGLNRRYLLMYRVVKYKKPIVKELPTPIKGSDPMTGKDVEFKYKFENGAVDMELFLVDLKSNEVVTSFRASGQGDCTAAREITESGIEYFLISCINHNLQAKVLAKLKETTGGDFTF
jgi:hypothetical protein